MSYLLLPLAISIWAYYFWNRSLKPINLMSKGRFDDSIRLEDKLEVRYSENKKLKTIHRFNKGASLSWMGESKQSNEVLESTDASCVSANLRAMLRLHKVRNFLILGSDNDLDQAENELKVLCTEGCSNPRLVNLFQAHLYDHRGKFTDSQTLLEKIEALKIVKTRKSSPLIWLIYPKKLNELQEDFFRGYHLFRQGEWALAGPHFEKVAKCEFNFCYSAKAKEFLAKINQNNKQ